MYLGEAGPGASVRRCCAGSRALVWIAELCHGNLEDFAAVPVSFSLLPTLPLPPPPLLLLQLLL